MRKRIALLIPCYNSAQHLPMLLAQAKAQTEPFAEIICYDDCSTDETRDVIRAHGATLLTATRNRGVGAARQHLWQAATSPWVHYHDADDGLDPRFVERFSEALTEPDLAAVCALHVRFLDNPDASYVRTAADVTNPAGLVAFMLNYFVHLNALVVPRASVERAGGFPPWMRFSEDRDFVNRLAAMRQRFVYLPEVLATWNRHGGSLTRSKTEAQQGKSRRWKLLRAYRRLAAGMHRHIGNNALTRGFETWCSFMNGEGAEYLAETRRYVYLARLCGTSYWTQSHPLVRRLTQWIGTEPAFFCKWVQKRLRHDWYPALA